MRSSRFRSSGNTQLAVSTVRTVLALLVLCGRLTAFAQNPPSPVNPASSQSSAEKALTPQKPDRVTTTVVVRGEVKDDYASDPRTAASLDDTPLQETPLSVTSVTGAVIGDQIARTLSDVVKNDASVGEDYAPVGYYGDFQIRGFPLDLATALANLARSCAEDERRR